jgi:phage shock protein A
VEEIKLREIEAAAKLYDVNKKLQAYEATAADMRRKREDYIAKVTELEQKQLQMNKFEISLMVREKMARAQSIGFNEWVFHIVI